MDANEIEYPEWPLRPWFLAAGLGLAGLLLWAFSHGAEQVPWRMAATAFVFFGSLAAAFTVERERWKEPALFALAVGLVMAGLAWRAVAAGDRYADPQYGFFAGVIATGLALPLFQSGFRQTRFRTPYERVHYHVWSDAIGAGGGLAFVGASWLVLAVLGALFNLLKMHWLYDLMGEEWFGWTWSAAAFGAALGILRNQMKILGTLQAVVMTVLSVLAVPLALGLATFLIAMAVSGPEVLWQATRSATPILLACAAGSWVLANAILRDSDAEMTGNRVLRWAARALALVILPLTIFAAVSLGTRVAQHGLSPERIWGLIAIAVACAYGLAWLVAMIRGGKTGWGDRLRQANLHLAAAICVLAFVLALPIFDFGAISARNQVARLESGKVSPDDFDYSALRWDFGDAGRRALAMLAKSDNAKVAELAQVARKQTRHSVPFEHLDGVRGADEIDVRIETGDPAVREMIFDYLKARPHICEFFCVAVEVPGAPDGRHNIVFLPRADAPIEYVQLPEDIGSSWPPRDYQSIDLRENSRVEIGKVEKRYIIVDGKPVGEPLD